MLQLGHLTEAAAICQNRGFAPPAKATFRPPWRGWRRVSAVVGSWVCS